MRNSNTEPQLYSLVCQSRGPEYYDYTYHDLNEDVVAPKYRLGDYVDKGTFGRCFEARALDEAEYNYCIKVLKRHKELHAEKIVREVFILKKLQGGPGVVRFYGVIKDPKCELWLENESLFQLYEREDNSMAKTLGTTKKRRDRTAMVFEFIDATPWKAVSPRFTLMEITKFFFQLLVTLDYAHSMGIMHRDIKPPNCLLDMESDRLVVVDWGQAEFFLPDNQLNCQVGGISYKAPELVYGGNVPVVYHHYAVDIWSFGTMLTNTVMFGDERDLFFGRTREHLIESIALLLGTEDMANYLNSNPQVKISLLTDELINQKPLTKRIHLSIHENCNNRHKVSEEFYNLVDACLQYDPNKRPTPLQILTEFPFFESARQYYAREISGLDWSDKTAKGAAKNKELLHYHFRR